MHFNLACLKIMRDEISKAYANFIIWKYKVFNSLNTSLMRYGGCWTLQMLSDSSHSIIIVVLTTLLIIDI
jgi:hypothetical protein